MTKFLIFTLTILLVTRSLTPDSFDLLLKENFGLGMGVFYMHPTDFFLFIVILIVSIFNRRLILTRETGALFFFLLSSCLVDILGSNEMDMIVAGNIVHAYWIIAVPLFSSVVIIRYVALSGNYRAIVAILSGTYFFLALQFWVFSFFPIESWIHEIIDLGIFSVYRTITTSGPPTAGGYVFLFLFLTYTHIQRCMEGKGQKRGDAIITSSPGFMLITTVITFTRGLSILALGVYLNACWRKVNRRNASAYCVIIGSIIILSILMMDARVDSGYGERGDQERIDVLIRAWDTLQDTNLAMGAGFGTLYKRDIHWYEMDNSYNFTLRAPHNINILFLLELGFLRVVGLYYMFYSLFQRYLRNRNKMHAINLLLTMLILFNTETILLYSEYNYAWFLYLASGYYLNGNQMSNALKSGV